MTRECDVDGRAAIRHNAAMRRWLSDCWAWINSWIWQPLHPQESRELRRMMRESRALRAQLTKEELRRVDEQMRQFQRERVKSGRD